MLRKIRFLTLLILLYLSTSNTRISFAQEEPDPFLALPEGAIARLGNGRIYDVKYSNDGMQLVAASSIGKTLVSLSGSGIIYLWDLTLP